MFDILVAPKISKAEILKIYGVEFTKIFEDCDDSIGIAMDFEWDKKQRSRTTISAKEYAKEMKELYIKFNCLAKPISQYEYDIRRSGNHQQNRLKDHALIHKKFVAL